MTEISSRITSIVGNRLAEAALGATVASVALTGCSGVAFEEESKYGNKDIPSPVHNALGDRLAKAGYPVSKNCDSDASRDQGDCPIFWDPATKKYFGNIVVSDCTVELHHVGDDGDFELRRVVHGKRKATELTPQLLNEPIKNPEDQITDFRNVPFTALEKAITIVKKDGRLGKCDGKAHLR